MPELPEVETTVSGLKKVLKGLSLKDVWSDYPLSTHAGKQHIKNPLYYKKFREIITNKKVIGIRRRGKNILIDLKGGHTILIHMKMTGHLLYGKYKRTDNKQPTTNNKGKETWELHSEEKKDGPLADPFNRFIRLVFTLSNGKHLAFSDLRKFAKVMISPSKEIEKAAGLDVIGPEPLENSFTLETFRKRLSLKTNWKIKQVLMDQSVIAGIGNIYSDEILFEAEIHPSEAVQNIPAEKIKKAYVATKKILKTSIGLGGDSMSDYRNINGERGGFQNKHKAYRQTGKPCSKKGCGGTIVRIKQGGRSAHFCSHHQQLLRKKLRV